MNHATSTLPAHIRAILAGKIRAAAPTGEIAQPRKHEGESPLKTRTLRGADVIDAMGEIEAHDCPLTWTEGEEGGSVAGRVTLGGWDW